MIKITSVILTALLLPLWAGAASGVTYHGRILRSDGTAVDGQFVGFRLRVMDGNTGICEMYQETRTKDMRNSAGTFSIIVGDGTVVGSFNVNGASYFDDIFQNNRTFNFTAPAGCVATPYTPDVRHGRVLNVQFRESPSDPWEDLPPMTIAYVPFAYTALVANQVGSHTSASLLRVENAGIPQSISALTPANYTTLMSILGGSYISAVSGTAGQITASTSTGTATLSLTDVSGVTPATYGSSTLIPVITVDQKGRVTSVTTAAASGSGGSAGISALTGDVTASGSGSVAATISANAVTTAKILDANVTNSKLATDAVTLAKLASDSVNSSKIVDGSIVGADISSTAALSVASIAATGNVAADTLSTNGIALYELAGNGTNYLMLKAADNMAADLTLKWPAADGASGQVLATDGSGNLTWATALTASTAYVNGGNAFAGNASIGLTDAYRLDFKTNNTAQMTISASGNVGIGTTSPLAPLHVAKNTQTYNLPGSGGLMVADVATTKRINIGYDATLDAGWIQSEYGGIGTRNLILNPNGGNVGIGTTSPSSILTVNGDVSQTIGMGRTASGAGNNLTVAAGSAQSGATNQVGGNLILSSGTATGTGTSNIYFNTVNINGVPPTVDNTSSTKMTILGNGNVGIGATTPGTKLEVSGTIRVGDGGETCGASYTGGIRYNGGNLQFCNGTSWGTLGVAGAGITALTGDVTASGSGSVAATIANDAVTFAKMQNVSTNKLLGRSTAASGDVEELSIGTGLNLAAGVLTATGSDTFAGLPCGNGYVPYKTAGAWACKEVASINTASTIVTRDVSGDFVAGAGTFNTSVKITDGAAGGQVTLSAPAAFTSYALKLPTADGSSNQVLKTDGSGNLGWVTALTSTTGYVNGGNAFAGNATIGLTDAYRLDFKTNNTARMSLDASGNVAIGTTTPAGLLDLSSGAGTPANPLLYVHSNPYSTTASFDPVKFLMTYNGAAANAGTLTGVLNNVLSSGTRSNTNLYSNYNLLQISNTGGTSAYAAANYNLIQSSAASGTIANLYGTKTVIDSTSTGVITNAFGDYVKITSAGGVATGYGVYIDTIAGTSNYGLYQASSTNNNYFAGSVGIGTMSPNAKLDIKGALAMSGSSSGYVGFQPAAAAGSTIWTLPSADGSSGQVLKTDGSGILSWVTASSGSGDFKADGTVPMTGTLKMGGNAIYGNSTSGGNLTLESTSHATKGVINLQPNGGKIGVGLSNPFSNFANTSSNLLDGRGTGMYDPSLLWAGSTTAYVAGISQTFSTGNGLLVKVAGTGDSSRILTLNANGTDVFNVNGSGNVGIGVATPSEKVHIAGNIQLTSAGTQISSSGTQLKLQQTGDSLGGSSLTLVNRAGANGAIFENSSLDLVDFGFKGNSGAQSNLRFEHRASQVANAANTQGEFQIIGNADAGAGNLVPTAFFGNGAILLAAPAPNGNYVASSAKVGIGVLSPAVKLDVAGTISSVAVSNASTTIDFSTGNLQYTSSSCGSLTLNNLHSGASYQLAIQGTAGGTCTLTAYTGVASGALTVLSGPVNLTQTANKHLLIGLSVMGSYVYVTSVDGY